MTRKETVIVCSAHSDDFVIGAGGTIANYTQEGKKVIAIVFSYGELSHPWLKEDVVKKMRSEESYKASKILGCKVIFFDLKEGKFKNGYTGVTKERLLTIFQNEQPTKVLTHSHEDPHPDHRAVHKITLDVHKKLTQKPDVFIYSVWNPVSFKTNFPSLYSDVSKTFSKKLKALKTFQSQKVHVAYPLLLLLWRGIKDGFKIRKRFGEHFFKIR